jgi:hypothetical protein
MMFMVLSPPKWTPIFKELALFTYKVSDVMCLVSVCKYCWSIKGWIHSKRRKNEGRGERGRIRLSRREGSGKDLLAQ